MELREELPGSCRVGGRKIEEGIPSTGALPGRATIVRPRGLNNIPSIRRDGSDQGPGRIERETSLPFVMSRILPVDDERLVFHFRGDRPGMKPGKVDGDGRSADGLRHNGKDDCVQQPFHEILQVFSAGSFAAALNRTGLPKVNLPPMISSRVRSFEDRPSIRTCAA
jgi:hypothetical protein